MDKKEKKVKKQNKEQVKKTEPKEKQSKVNLDKKKKLLILISAIVLVAIIGITIFFTLRNDDEYTLADVEPTISTLEDGTYYIFGSPNNQSFEVETKEDFTYKVVDEENNEVKVSTTKKDNKVVINAPEKLYEDGKTYTLTITNGTFTEEDLKEASVVSFSIVRKSKQTSELNKDVKAVSSETNKVSETDDKITLTSDEEYKTGDIILIDNKKAYKVESAENGTYQLTIPAISEVFDEIDYYGSAYLNLSEFEENEEIEEYLIAYAEETLIEKLIPTVNAASKVSVDCDWSDKRDAFVAKIHIETNPGDKVFKKSFLEHHKLSFDYEVELKVKLDYDIDDDYVDVNFTLQITNTPSFTLETQSETLDKIKDGLKAYTAGENALALLKSDYDSVETDTKKLKQTVGTVPIPTPFWFFTAELDFGLIMEFDVKANMNATLTNTNKITIGVNSEKGVYGKTKYTNKINASAFGEASMRLGSQMDLEASLLGITEVSGGLKGGIYGNATLDIKSEVSDDKLSANLLATTKAGLFSTIVVEAKVITEKFEKEISNTELELYSYELPLSSESEKTEPVVKEEDTTQKPETNNNSNNNTNNNNNDSSNNSSNDSEYIDDVKYSTKEEFLNYKPEIKVKQGLTRIDVEVTNASNFYPLDNDGPYIVYYAASISGPNKNETYDFFSGTGLGNFTELSLGTTYEIAVWPYAKDENDNVVNGKKTTATVTTLSSYNYSSEEKAYIDNLFNMMNSNRKTKFIRDPKVDLAAQICASSGVNQINYQNTCLTLAGINYKDRFASSYEHHNPFYGKISYQEFYQKHASTFEKVGYARAGIGYYNGVVYVIMVSLCEDVDTTGLNTNTCN